MSNIVENDQRHSNGNVNSKDTSSNLQKLRITENKNNIINNRVNELQVNNQDSNNVNGNINSDNNDQMYTSSCIANRPL